MVESSPKSILQILWSYKQYWLLPVVVAALLLLLITIAGTWVPLRPFIYPDF